MSRLIQAFIIFELMPDIKTTATNKQLEIFCLSLTLDLFCLSRFLTTTLDFRMISWAQHISTWSPWNTRGLLSDVDPFLHLPPDPLF